MALVGSCLALFGAGNKQNMAWYLQPHRKPPTACGGIGPVPGDRSSGTTRSWQAVPGIAELGPGYLPGRRLQPLRVGKYH